MKKDDRIDVWERLFRVAETPEERLQLWKMSQQSSERFLASAGFLRTTYVKGVSAP